MKGFSVSVFVLLVSVVLAGCGAIEAPGSTTAPESGTDGSTTTVPGSGTGNTTTSVARDVAPGVTTAGIEDVDALLAAHTETLLADGARIRLAVWTESRDGTVTQRSTQTLRLGPGASVATTSGSGMGPDGELTADTWLNDSISVFRFRNANETTYRVIDPLAERGNLVFAGNIDRYLEADPQAFTVESVSAEDGRQTATLTASVDLVNGTDGRETDMRLDLDERGAILRFDLEQRRPDGERYLIDYDLEATGVTPDRPSWVEDIPAGVFLEADLAIDVHEGSFVVIANAGPDAVPAGATVTVIASGSTYERTLDRPLGVDEERWLWIDEETRTLSVADGAPSGVDARSLDGQATVVVRTPDGTAIRTAELAWRETR